MANVDLTKWALLNPQHPLSVRILQILYFGFWGLGGKSPGNVSAMQWGDGFLGNIE